MSKMYKPCHSSVGTTPLVLTVLLLVAIFDLHGTIQVPSQPTIECGDSPRHPTNVTYEGRAAGIYVEGRQLQCHSISLSGSQRHTIFDVFSDRCGEQAGGGRRTVRVRLQHVSGLIMATDALFVLTCIFPDHVTSSARAGERDLRTSHTNDVEWPSGLVAEGAVSVTLSTKDDESEQSSESSTQSLRFHQPPPPHDTHSDGRHTGAPLSTAGVLQHDGLHEHGRRRTGYDITTPVSLAARPGTSILKLNVVDEVGDTPTVVVPAKLLALELHSGNFMTFGTVVVTRCQVTNPLGNEGEELGLVIDKGCGTGDVLPKSASFRRSRHGQITPLFSVPEEWARAPALVFSCDVIICARATDCRQVCPTAFAPSISPGVHDVAVTLESQVLTSCPLTEQLEGEGLSPPGCDLGFEVPLPAAVGDKDNNNNNNNNNTASMTFPSLHEGSWLAQHLHYLLIICVLGIFIVVFMSATFLKMAAMQRHVCQTNKMMADAAAAAAAVTAAARETQNQSTQTARPLPSVPSTRRGGRRDEDGTSTAVVQARHSQAMTPTTTSTLLTSESSAFTYPEVPDGAQGQPVWIPVSHSPPTLQTFPSPQVHSFSQPAGNSSGTDSAHAHVHHVNVIEVTAQPQVVEVRGHSKPTNDVEVARQNEGEEEKSSSWTRDVFAPKPSSFSGRGGTVLGVNSLKRSLERDGYFSHRGNLTAGRDLAMNPGCAVDGTVIARQSRDTGRAELGVAVVSPDLHRSTHQEHYRPHQDPHKPHREPQPHQDPHKPHREPRPHQDPQKPHREPHPHQDPQKPHIKQQPHQQTGTIAQETTRL